MSLFKTKEWWRTTCGACETFDGQSLLAAPLFGDEKGDVLVVGSHDGYVRIYSPSSRWAEDAKSPTNYSSADLMIESRVGECVVDAKAGRFVSGSGEPCLAVLTGRKLIVHTVALAEESAEHGDRCELKVAYEHPLAKFPASLTTGPFGGARGRDFLCVQCLDGTLLFYEQEAYGFSQVLGSRLLPEPIVYVARHDLFVTASSSWLVECYRYQSMAERAASAVEAGERLEPDWSFNVGEAVLAVEAVTLSSFETGILVLGEKHLYCLRDNCAAVKHAKRLEYRPVCFRAYVIEPDGKLMVLVIADTGTMMIYEGSTLRWSARLPFVPVAVARAQLRHLQAAIVVLAEDGRLEACYLGSEPSLFVVPPLHPRGYDYAAAERRLAELRAVLEGSVDAADRTDDAGTEAELLAEVTASPELRPRVQRTDDDREEEKDRTPRGLSCTVTVELSSCATLTDLQVCVDVARPFVASETFYALPNLCESCRFPRLLALVPSRPADVKHPLARSRRTARDERRGTRGRRLAPAVRGGGGDDHLPIDRREAAGPAENGAAAAEDDSRERRAGNGLHLVRLGRQEQRSSARLHAAVPRIQRGPMSATGLERAGTATRPHRSRGHRGPRERGQSVPRAGRRCRVLHPGRSTADGQAEGEERRRREPRARSSAAGAAADRRALCRSAGNRQDNERDRTADQPAEKRREENSADREGEPRQVRSGRGPAAPLRRDLSRDLRAPRGSREGASGTGATWSRSAHQRPAAAAAVQVERAGGEVRRDGSGDRLRAASLGSTGLGGDRGRDADRPAGVRPEEERHREDVHGLERADADRERQGAGQAEEAAGSRRRAAERLQGIRHRGVRAERRREFPMIRIAGAAILLSRPVDRGRSINKPEVQCV